jgi:hypothetical protein
MKSLFILLALAATSTIHCQFEDLVIVKTENNQGINGTTYKFYAQLKNNGDHVHIIFGDEYNTLSIETTEPFYQNKLGGSLSTNINPNVEKVDPKVKYDSYFTIGRTNSLENTLASFNLNFSDFESKGLGFTTQNGAWYVTPDQPQAYCKDGNKFILIMQLTTTGVVTGNLNLQGKDLNNEVWKVVDKKFNTENAISLKTFEKLNKKNLKDYAKSLVKKFKAKDGKNSTK